MIVTRGLALAWTILVLGLHSVPRYRLMQVPGGRALVGGSGPDKVLHVVLFAVLGVLWLRCFPRRPLRVLAAGIVYGMVLELYQGGLISGRTASPADALADTFGMLVGTALAARLFKDRWLSRSPSQTTAEA
jgi:hypothetical protein